MINSTNMKEILQKLTAHLTLDREEARAVLLDVGTGKIHGVAGCRFSHCIYDASDHRR